MKLKTSDRTRKLLPQFPSNWPNKLHLAKRIAVNGVSQLCPVVISNAGEFKPHWVVARGEEQYQPDGSFYLEWWEHGQRRRVSVGRDCRIAFYELFKKEAKLRNAAFGRDSPSCRRLQQAAEDFLEEMQMSRQYSTLRAYAVALRYFRESCQKRYVAEIKRIDLLRFVSFLREEKELSPRTVHNKFACILTFLEAQGITGLIRRSDRPRFIAKEVTIYEHGELDKLYPVCSLYHRTLYDFLLMSGFREQEAIYTTWQDINWNPGTINVRWKSRYSWMPKAHKEREVPVPAKLLDALENYRAWHSQKDKRGRRTKDDALVFSTASGKPDIHMLRALKRNARRASLDPKRYGLHKFRATFATRHLQAGVDLRTVMSWMGQTNLESVIRYLKPARNEAMREKVNATFA